MRTRTYEELLINRITKAFESMDNVNAEFFDEILDELEMLFKLKPNMYEQLMKWKQYHESIFQQSMNLANKKVRTLEDEIAQDITLKYYQTKIDWSYRKDMLETMINILNEHKMIPFTNPDYAELDSFEQTLPDEEPQQAPEELPPEPPIPQPPINKTSYQKQNYIPTNLPPKTQNIPPQQISTYEDALIKEAERLAKEEEEIKNLSEQKPSISNKKGFGLIKKQ